MSQIQINNNLNVANANIQQEQNVKNGQIGQPRADLPPELHNARPAGRGIVGRVVAFLFGAGTAGGASAALGGGALLSGAIGTGATATLGGAAVVGGIATGGAALIGGGVTLGLFAAIRAIVNHFRRAPEPDPRVQNPPQNNLPQANPAEDASNNAIADAVAQGRALPESLQNAVNSTVSRMREIYGEALMPQGTPLITIMGGLGKLPQEIRALEGDVTPAKIGELVEKEIRDNMASEVLDNAFRPHCGEDRFLPRELRRCAAKKHPQLLADLKTADTRARVQEILSGHAGEFREMAALHQRAKALHEGTRAKVITVIARSLGLDADVVAPLVKPNDFGDRMRKLTDDIVQGKVAADGVEQAFSKLADDLAKPYVDALAAVDADGTLSAATKKAMKMQILAAPNSPNPELYSKGIAAGKNVDVTALKIALDRNMPAEAVNALLLDLGEKLNETLKEQYGEDAWNSVWNGTPDNLRITQGAAFMAMLDKEPGLMDALRGREDVDLFNLMNNIQDELNVSVARKAGAIAAYAGHVRLQNLSLDNEDFVKMEKQTQSLNAIRNAEIPQELKTRWTGMVLSGAIADPAMVQALIANVSGLSEETRPVMERYILLQSYAPADAEASAQKAQLFAQEMAGWRNFDTAGDQAMAPVANWVREDLSNSLYAGQNFDRGISDQMKLDVQRADVTLNGAEMKHADGDDVAKSIRRIMPTEDAAKLVSAILNQRTFSYVSTLSTQINAETGVPLPQDVLGGLTKMASRNILQAMENNIPPMLHFDLGNQADHDFRVTVQNGRAYIEMSETVGLDSGLGTGANGRAQLVGKARYTLVFECDLGTPPSILSVNLRQRILPAA